MGNGKKILFQTLNNYMNRLGVDLEGVHEEFGPLKDCFSNWIRQKYFDKSKDEVLKV